MIRSMILMGVVFLVTICVLLMVTIDSVHAYIRQGDMVLINVVDF